MFITFVKHEIVFLLSVTLFISSMFFSETKSFLSKLVVSKKF